jgi:hypothetical protein
MKHHVEVKITIQVGQVCYDEVWVGSEIEHLMTLVDDGIITEEVRQAVARLQARLQWIEHTQRELWSQLEVGAVLREKIVRGDQLWVVDSWTDGEVLAHEAHAGQLRTFTAAELLDYYLFPAQAMQRVLAALGLDGATSRIQDE